MFCRLASNIIKTVDLNNTGDIVVQPEDMGDAPNLKTKILRKHLGARLACAGDVGHTVQEAIKNYKHSHPYPVPTSPQLVAWKVAEAHPCSQAIIVGIDPYTTEPKLFAVDTGRRVRECNTWAIGKGFQDRNKFLSAHKEYYLSKDIGSEDYKDGLVRLAIRALIEVRVLNMRFFISRVAATFHL